MRVRCGSLCYNGFKKLAITIKPLPQKKKDLQDNGNNNENKRYTNRIYDTTNEETNEQTNKPTKNSAIETVSKSETAKNAHYHR